MDMKDVEKELRKGLEATTQFRSLLIEKERGDEFSEERKIEFMKNYSKIMLNSFDNAIYILNKIVHSMKMGVSTSSLGQSMTIASHPKNRLRTIEALNITPDGHTWRKYGQKSILKTKHPREYYKCVYKEDQNCQATKQIQKISNNPTKYRITYFAQHSCQPLLNNNYVISNVSMLDSLEKDLTNIISFELRKPTPSPKQDLNNLVVLNSSSFSNNHVPNPPLPHEGCDDNVSLSTTIFLPMKSLDFTTVKEPPSLANEIACLNLQDEVLYSPRVFMCPNYMASSNMEATDDYNKLMVADDSFDMGGSLLDLPLWE